MRMKVAALYVQKYGCYFESIGIDAWDEERDARKYNGPYPVIAHPPCQRWGKMARVNFARWGGEHNRPGNDGGCFEAALKSVNKFGGVLEHPAQSYAWKEYGLSRPTPNQWIKSKEGWVCEVWQSAYGHRANKATWLYYKGIVKPFDLKWNRIKGSHQVGFQDKRGKARNKPTLSKKEANATPEEFKRVLIDLAWHSKTNPAS
jgi:hypothetical protein